MICIFMCCWIEIIKCPFFKLLMNNLLNLLLNIFFDFNTVQWRNIFHINLAHGLWKWGHFRSFPVILSPWKLGILTLLSSGWSAFKGFLKLLKPPFGIFVMDGIFSPLKRPLWTSLFFTEFFILNIIIGYIVLRLYQV